MPFHHTRTHAHILQAHLAEHALADWEQAKDALLESMVLSVPLAASAADFADSVRDGLIAPPGFPAGAGAAAGAAGAAGAAAGLGPLTLASFGDGARDGVARPVIADATVLAYAEGVQAMAQAVAFAQSLAGNAGGGGAAFGGGIGARGGLAAGAPSAFPLAKLSPAARRGDPLAAEAAVWDLLECIVREQALQGIDSEARAAGAAGAAGMGGMGGLWGARAGAVGAGGAAGARPRPALGFYDSDGASDAAGVAAAAGAAAGGGIADGSAGRYPARPLALARALSDRAAAEVVGYGQLSRLCDAAAPSAQLDAQWAMGSWRFACRSMAEVNARQMSGQAQLLREQGLGALPPRGSAVSPVALLQALVASDGAGAAAAGLAGDADVALVRRITALLLLQMRGQAAQEAAEAAAAASGGGGAGAAITEADLWPHWYSVEVQLGLVTEESPYGSGAGAAAVPLPLMPQVFWLLRHGCVKAAHQLVASVLPTLRRRAEDAARVPPAPGGPDAQALAAGAAILAAVERCLAGVEHTSASLDKALPHDGALNIGANAARSAADATAVHARTLAQCLEQMDESADAAAAGAPPAGPLAAVGAHGDDYLGKVLLLCAAGAVAEPQHHERLDNYPTGEPAEQLWHQLWFAMLAPLSSAVAAKLRTHADVDPASLPSDPVYSFADLRRETAPDAIVGDRDPTGEAAYETAAELLMRGHPEVAVAHLASRGQPAGARHLADALHLALALHFYGLLRTRPSPGALQAANADAAARVRRAGARGELPPQAMLYVDAELHTWDGRSAAAAAAGRGGDLALDGGDGGDGDGGFDGFDGDGGARAPEDAVGAGAGAGGRGGAAAAAGFGRTDGAPRGVEQQALLSCLSLTYFAVAAAGPGGLGAGVAAGQGLPREHVGEPANLPVLNLRGLLHSYLSHYLAGPPSSPAAAAAAAAAGGAGSGLGLAKVPHAPAWADYITVGFLDDADAAADELAVLLAGSEAFTTLAGSLTYDAASRSLVEAPDSGHLARHGWAAPVRSGGAVARIIMRAGAQCSGARREVDALRLFLRVPEASLAGSSLTAGAGGAGGGAGGGGAEAGRAALDILMRLLAAMAAEPLPPAQGGAGFRSSDRDVLLVRHRKCSAQLSCASSCFRVRTPFCCSQLPVSLFALTMSFPSAPLPLCPCSAGDRGGDAGPGAALGRGAPRRRPQLRGGHREPGPRPARAGAGVRHVRPPGCRPLHGRPRCAGRQRACPCRRKRCWHWRHRRRRLFRRVAGAGARGRRLAGVVGHLRAAARGAQVPVRGAAARGGVGAGGRGAPPQRPRQQRERARRAAGAAAGARGCPAQRLQRGHAGEDPAARGVHRARHRQPHPMTCVLLLTAESVCSCARSMAS